jgi:hypothetical protein
MKCKTPPEVEWHLLHEWTGRLYFAKYSYRLIVRLAEGESEYYWMFYPPRTLDVLEENGCCHTIVGAKRACMRAVRRHERVLRRHVQEREQAEAKAEAEAAKL